MAINTFNTLIYSGLSVFISLGISESLKDPTPKPNIDRITAI